MKWPWPPALLPTMATFEGGVPWRGRGGAGEAVSQPLSDSGAWLFYSTHLLLVVSSEREGWQGTQAAGADLSELWTGPDRHP